MQKPDSHQTSLVRVMVWGTALAFGIVGAIIGSMRDFFHGDVTFTLSSRTFMGFFAGWVVGWLFWTFVLRRFMKAQRPPPGID